MLTARHRSVSLAAVLLLLTQAGSSQSPGGSPDLVISQVYGGGGNTGAPLNADFIEVFNRGTAPVSLNGLSLQYASATGTGAFGSPGITRLPDVMLAPGQYFLVREASGTNGAPLPQPFYTAGSPIAMGAGAGKVALVRGTSSLGCNGGSTPCGPAQLASIIDLVGYGNANFFEGSGTALGASNTTAVIRNDGGRIDTDDNRADFTSGAPNPRNTGNAIALSIDDVTVAEGNASNPVATFTVSLNSPALVPVSFTIETVDETAIAGLDYVAQPSQTIAIAVGERTAAFDVTILADFAIEPDETFAVVLTNVTGVAVADDRGIGTILNDDLPVYAIHELQGAGASSPYGGERVATTGVVTGLKANGYFMQTPDDAVDAFPETSEGIFVFTGSAPAVSIGDEVGVTGLVVEFRRASDARPGTLTEIGGTVQTTVLSSGNPLPAAVDAATFDASAADRTAQLERYEAMLVRAAALEVVAPTNGFGELYGVIPGTPRPFREPGIDVADTMPADAASPATIPRFDGNLERIMVDTDEALSGPGGTRRPAVQAATGATL
ncbi:MAG: lamin tail domain-containing protein, partial [Vicinamibacterales bacterium]